MDDVTLTIQLNHANTSGSAFDYVLALSAAAASPHHTFPLVMVGSEHIRSSHTTDRDPGTYVDADLFDEDMTCVTRAAA